jgi:hypothetical protein
VIWRPRRSKALVQFIARLAPQAIILAADQARELNPNWYELDFCKLRNLSKSLPKASKLPGLKDAVVVGAPPILISSEGFIINGKHRACWAALSGLGLESYVISDKKEIRRLPGKIVRELGIEQLMRIYSDRELIVCECEKRNVYRIGDLIRGYNMTDWR